MKKIRKSLLFGLMLGIITALSACGNAPNKSVVSISDAAKEYEFMSYKEFKEQTGNEAEFYHGDLFIGESADFSVCVVYSGEYNEDTGEAVLSDEAVPIRLQGTLGALMNGIINGEMTLEEITENLSFENNKKADIEISEGGGTAYYVGNDYVQIRFDSDEDGEYDRKLLIVYDKSEVETVGSESVAWLEII